jgi:hypothetical protein
MDIWAHTENIHAQNTHTSRENDPCSVSKLIRQIQNSGNFNAGTTKFDTFRMSKQSNYL